MEFLQAYTSVFSLIEANPSDLVSVRKTASLIKENTLAKLGVSELPKRTDYKPMVIVGPSGAGKGTLIEYLKSEFPD